MKILRIPLLYALLLLNITSTLIPHDKSVESFVPQKWTALTKSIAKLNSSIIESQSLINTMSTYLNFVGVGSLVVTAGISLVKQSPAPLLTAGLIYGASLLTFKPAVKYIYNDSIQHSYTDVLDLLKTQETEAPGAKALCKRGKELLHSNDLVPPYTSLQPEKEYTTMLDTIHNALPSEKAENVAQDQSLKHYIRPNTFTALDFSQQVPFIFHENYDFSFYGIEKLNPFDAKKYSRLANYLIDHLGISKDQFHKPEEVSQEDMLLIHTPSYLECIKNSHTLGMIADIPVLGLFPNSIADKKLLVPVRLATGGTILGAELALKYGWAVNLAGGYHHAKTNEPVYGGFCVINDICIAAQKVFQKHPDYKILIVDLDAHQGNGHEEAAKNEPRIAIFDMYNGDTWPGDFACVERINFDYPLKSKTKDAEYLSLFAQEIKRAIDITKPDLIIYNAGTDIYEHDPIGILSITRQGIIDRDDIMFREATSRNIPILMVLSGGYHKDSYAIIGESLTNVWKKYLTQK